MTFQVWILYSVLFSCANPSPKKLNDDIAMKNNEKVIISSFGKLQDGTEIFRYTLKNNNGMTMGVINYGGIIISLTAPDKNGIQEDVILGFDSLAAYEADQSFQGALIGRYANRIAKGKFRLENREYTLELNNNGNTLHGGFKGFHKVFWNIEEVPTQSGAAVKLKYVSKDMEAGFPGELKVEVQYLLTDANELHIIYEASTDKTTVVNLMHHAYFNLSGNKKADILSHELFLNADEYLPVNTSMIPLGKASPVSGTPFDFRKKTLIGLRINEEHNQLKLGSGYDHCWVLNKSNGEVLSMAAILSDPLSGRTMTVYTTEPGVQFYSGNFMDGSVTGKFKSPLKFREGVCLETEHYPDSPNKPEYPNVVLKPNKLFRSETVFTFGTL
jgi:aldose 1-epimerase